jgi:N-acetyl sugar amidotransferase
MIKYCTKCFLPNTKPDLYFDADGSCGACLAFNDRKFIDWDNRKNELNTLLNDVKASTDSSWDCLIPVSGGKDSTFQVLKMLELGVNPLCVTSTTCDLTPIGRQNIENLKNLGVDLLEFSPNPKVRKILNKVALEQVGDIAWPEHVGIFTIPVTIAVKFKIKLIIWGENSQNEYGGPPLSQKNSELNRNWLEEFGGLLGLRVSDFLSTYDLSMNDLRPYIYPTPEQISKIGLRGIFLGHYLPWDGLSNYLLSTAYGFTNYGKAVEGSAVSYENLDNYQHGIHDYFKFLKFGFGRTTDLISTHIRRDRISRTDGLEIIKNLDGKYPESYLGKSLEEILSHIDMNIGEFDAICEKFTNKHLFLTNSNGELVREGKSLIKINYDN